MYSALIVDDEAPARQLLKALGRWNDIHVTNIYEADFLINVVVSTKDGIISD